MGLLGCGTIGTEIALAIADKRIPANLTHVYDVSRSAAESLANKLEPGTSIVENPHLLSSSPVDIIVEAASQRALCDTALNILQNKKDLMIMSVGALLDESILGVILDAAREFRAGIYVPAGAVAGLDGIRAVRDELSSVTLTTTKHPDSLRGAQFFEESGVNPSSITEPITIFEGSAMEAVSLFPANINVAAALSLSGMGGNATTVRIIADPAATTNTHRIEAMGDFGRMELTVENKPSAGNPRTSRLAVLSAIDTLRRYCTGGLLLG